MSCLCTLFVYLKISADKISIKLLISSKQNRNAFNILIPAVQYIQFCHCTYVIYSLWQLHQRNVSNIVTRIPADLFDMNIYCYPTSFRKSFTRVMHSDRGRHLSHLMPTNRPLLHDTSLIILFLWDRHTLLLIQSL